MIRFMVVWNGIKRRYWSVVMLEEICRRYIIYMMNVVRMIGGMIYFCCFDGL